MVYSHTFHKDQDVYLGYTVNRSGQEFQMTCKMDTSHCFEVYMMYSKHIIKVSHKGRLDMIHSAI